MVKRQPKNEILDRDRQAYLGICQMLFNNELAPGQKISYKDLSERLGISTTPVIHALKWLEFKGIVRHEPNRGYFTNKLSLQEVREIYETRIILETWLLGEAAGSVDEAGLADLKKAIEAHQEAVQAENSHLRMMTDREVHLAMAALAEREIQLRLLRDLFDRLLLKYSQSLVYVSMMSTSRDDHWAIYESLLENDGQAAREILSDHLTRVMDQILQGLAKIINAPKKQASDFISF